MYRIMLVKSKRDNFASLYTWLTHEVTTGSGNDATTSVQPMEFATEELLDAQVERMLNEEDYAKSDFIVVKYIDYTIDATDYDIE